MNIIFCKSNTVAGFLIRLFTFSKWNHVAIEYNGQVIDSTGRNGVSISSKYDFMRRYDETSTVRITDLNEFTVWSFLRSQIGSEYDFKGIFALPFRKSWQWTDKWFCSELVAAALLAGGKRIKLKSNRVTPRDLWVML